MKKDLVSVVIVNYNGREDLPGCLRSVFAQTYPEFEVIVIDNNSADNSVSWVKANYPRVNMVVNETNLGFARACNQGMEESSGEFVAFLNNDAVADADWLSALVGAVREATDIGAVMSKILLLDKEKPTLNSSGGVTHFLGISWSGSYGHPDGPVHNRKKEVAFASGAAMLAPRAALDRVTPFDEGFFMYCEDSDLSWRLRLAGYRVIYEPSSVVWHRYHFSKGKKKFFFLERNRLSMMLTNYEKRTLFLLALPACVFEIGMTVNALFGGWLRLKLKTYADLLRDRDRIREKRKMVQALRRLSDREITAVFVSEIDFAAVNSVFISVLNVFFKLYWKMVYRLIR